MKRGAPKPLGLQNGKIPNNAITASSYYNRYYVPWRGRFKQPKQGPYAWAWAAKVNNGQWLQVRFKRPKKVVAVAIQGRQDFNQWVTLFYLSSSVDEIREEWGNEGMPRFSFRNIGRDKLGSTSLPATRLERFHLSSKTLRFKSLMT